MNPKKRPDIPVIIEHETYLAKFQSGMFSVPEKKISFDIRNIQKYKIKPNLTVILLPENGPPITIQNGSRLVSWLDPLYEVRWASIGLIFLAALVTAWVKFGLTEIIPVFSYAIIGSAWAFYLYSLFRHSISFILQRIFLISLIVCGIPLYLFPFSFYIFAAFSIFFSIFLFFDYISKTKRYHTIYLSITWVMLAAFMYFWMALGVKNWNDATVHSLSHVNAQSSSDKSIVAGNIQWTPPEGWSMSAPYFGWTVALREKFVHQLNLLPVEKIFNTPTWSDAGWIALSDAPPTMLYNALDKYIETQKAYLWGDFIKASETVSQTWENGVIAYLRVYGFYNMYTRTDEIIYVVTVPFQSKPAGETGEKIISWVFAYTLPAGSPPDYYLDMIITRFSEVQKKSG